MNEGDKTPSLLVLRKLTRSIAALYAAAHRPLDGSTFSAPGDAFGSRFKEGKRLGHEIGSGAEGTPSAYERLAPVAAFQSSNRADTAVRSRRLLSRDYAVEYTHSFNSGRAPEKKLR